MDKINLDTIAEVTAVDGDLISISRTPIVDQVSRADLETQLQEKAAGIKTHQENIATLTEEIGKIQAVLDNAAAVEAKAIPVKPK